MTKSERRTKRGQRRRKAGDEQCCVATIARPPIAGRELAASRGSERDLHEVWTPSTLYEAGGEGATIEKNERPSRMSGEVGKREVSAGAARSSPSEFADSRLTRVFVD